MRPEILRSWKRSQRRVSRDVTRGAARRRGRHRAPSGSDSPLQTRGRDGSRPSCGVRPRTATWSSPSPTRETRILWTYGGRVMRRKAETVNFVAGGRWDDESRRHQRPRPRQPAAPAGDGVQRRALRPDRAQLGLLGRARPRPGHRRAARRHRPVDHLGPHPPDRPGHRPGDGPADRDRDAALGRRTRRCAGRRRAATGLDAAPARHRRGHARRPAGCCSTGGRPRSSRCSRCTPTGLSLDQPARAASTATRRSPSPRSRPRSPTCAPPSAASSPRAPTG